MHNISWSQAYPDLIDTDYKWFIPNEYTENPSQLWLDWLLDGGSLTSRLKHLSKGVFDVQVLDESWSQADSDQIKQFKLKPDERVWSRRVVLKGMGRPWVVAHTSISEQSMAGRLSSVLSLNDQPLGELLFSEPSMVRGAIYICRTQTGWGRRSTFFLYNQPLVVAEYFLNDFINRVNAR